MTAIEERAERDYLIVERLGILCGAEPAEPWMTLLAEEEAEREIQRLRAANAPPPEDDEETAPLTLDQIAALRTRPHDGLDSQRKLSKDYEKIGASGEAEFERVTGYKMMISSQVRGDGGKDFTVRIRQSDSIVPRRLDVKTAEKPWFLLVETVKVFADIFVLAHWHPATETATLLGWAWQHEVLAGELKNFGILSYSIHSTRLHPMKELWDILIFPDPTKNPNLKGPQP